MATLIARNDALAVAQVATLVPTPANATEYYVQFNGKDVGHYTSDASATAQEIVEAVQALLAALTAPPEALEATYTEDDTKIIATGLSSGKPFTIATPSIGVFTYNVTTAAKSPNHWIAENFSTLTLPGAADTVIIDGLTSSQSFKYGLDQNAVTLAALHIKASSAAEIGLPEFNTDSTTYYQGTYRDTHLKISADVLVIGEGSGPGSRRIKLNLGTNACAATIISTSPNRPSEGEAPVHLIGANASNTLHMISGLVDVGMLPNTGASCEWPAVVCSGGVLRFGEGCTLGSVEAAGDAYVEIRSAVTTLRTRDNGEVYYYGSDNIGTLDIAGEKVAITATGALTITQLNGYGGKELDLTNSDSTVTATNGTIYGTPENPFTIRDPNNKFAMTNAFSTPNGAQSLIIITGSGKNVRLT